MTHGDTHLALLKCFILIQLQVAIIFTIAFFSCRPSRPRPGHGHLATRPTRPTRPPGHAHGHGHPATATGHTATRPPGHPATRPPGHPATRPQPHGHTATRPHGHTATRPHGHTATRPHGHTATRPHGHTATIYFDSLSPHARIQTAVLIQPGQT